MLDFGWAELLIIVAVAVFVIGPKDIPNIMYGLGRMVRRIQYIKFAVSQQFDDLMNSHDIEEIRKGVNFETARQGDDIAHERQEDEEKIPAFVDEKEIYRVISKQYNQTFVTPSDYLEEFIKPLKEKSKILDIGCGTGVDCAYLNEQGFDVEGIDLSKDMLSFANEKYPHIKFMQADMREFKFPNNHYDALVSAYSIIHLKKQELESIFLKFFDALKVQGSLFLSLHGGVSEEKNQIEPFDPNYSFFLNVLSVEEATELLEKVGFTVVEIIERPSESAEEMPYEKITIFAEKS